MNLRKEEVIFGMKMQYMVDDCVHYHAGNCVNVVEIRRQQVLLIEVVTNTVKDLMDNKDWCQAFMADIGAYASLVAKWNECNVQQEEILHPRDIYMIFGIVMDLRVGPRKKCKGEGIEWRCVEM